LPGQYSDDITSDLFARPDKDSPARELLRDYHIIERAEEEGKTPHVDDFRMIKDEIAYYTDRYGFDGERYKEQLTKELIE
jgi:hypothetical protein